MLTDPSDFLLTTEEAAQLLRLSSRSLERRRLDGTGPKFLRMGGGRAIRYRRADLLLYLDQSVRMSTSEPR
jgi:predicted DNA-binding transcriptional regulator AlpA